MQDDRIYQSYVRACRLRRCTQETIRLYGRSYAQLRRHTATDLTSISRVELEEFFEARLGEVAASTAHKEWRNLRALFRWLTDEEYISRNPMARIPAPEVKETLPRILTESELKALFGACAGTNFRDRRDLALLRIMCEVGGPRRGEIGKIRVDDVDWRSSLVRLNGKTGERQIWYGDRTAAALERYMRLRDRHRLAGTEWLWLPSRGPMPANTVQGIVKRRAELAGIGLISCHTLRHTAAHRAMEAGLGGTDMQTIFGWKGPAMLLVYGRALRASRAQNAVRALALGDKL